MTMKHVLNAGLIASIALLTGCASGPTLNDLQAKLPSLSSEQGRVYFYRKAFGGFGAAIQENIMIDQKAVGKCAPNGVFFTDLPPGDYEATITHEVQRTLTFTLAKGEQKYVRCYLVPTILTTGHLIIELVDPAEALKEIGDLAYTGPKLD
jgi:hypothetical protein